MAKRWLDAAALGLTSETAVGSSQPKFQRPGPLTRTDANRLPVRGFACGKAGRLITGSPAGPILTKELGRPVDLIPEHELSPFIRDHVLHEARVL
jgi:hypothetical protein